MNNLYRIIGTAALAGALLTASGCGRRTPTEPQYKLANVQETRGTIDKVFVNVDERQSFDPDKKEYKETFGTLTYRINTGEKLQTFRIEYAIPDGQSSRMPQFKTFKEGEKVKVRHLGNIVTSVTAE